MTKQQRDQIVDAFKSRAEAEAKVRAASVVLAEALPDDGRSFAVPGTPYIVSRQGDTLAIKTGPAFSIDDLIK